MPKFIVLGWTKNGEYKRSPMGINGPQGPGILSFHASLYPHVFNDRRTAKRAVAKSQKWSEDNFPGSPWSVTHYAIDRLDLA